MNIVQEITKELFNDLTINAAKKLWSSNNQIEPVASDLPLRLYKTNANTVNLELVTQRRVETGIVSELGRQVKIINYAQPIGYYNFSKKIFGTKTEINIIKEFEGAYNYLLSNNLITTKYSVNKLSEIENILIGAVSLEAALNAEKLVDVSFKSNGFEFDLFMTGDDEYPQCFLDDKYNFNGPIVAYLFRKPNRPINPMYEYEKEFNSLYERSLLTAYRKV